MAVELGTPLAVETVGDLAVEGAGAQRALGAVVGGRHGALDEEDEEVGAVFLDHGLKLAA